MADTCYALLRQLKQDLAALPDPEPTDPEDLLQQQIGDYEAETARQRTAGALDKEGLARRLGVAAALRDWAGRLRRATLRAPRRPSTCCGGTLRPWPQTAKSARKRLLRPWRQPSTLWSRRLGRARRWWCSSPS